MEAPPNLGTRNIPLDPCQDSQAAARHFQLRFALPPAFPDCLSLGGPHRLPPQPHPHPLDFIFGTTDCIKTRAVPARNKHMFRFNFTIQPSRYNLLNK